MPSHLFTSESVSEGHPDKICDRISDEIVDMYLGTGDERVRVGCETLCTTNLVVIAGEVRPDPDRAAIEAKAREVIRDIGYEQESFHWEKAVVDVRLHHQSTDIARGVDASETKDEGAGDQGLMFGYACRETPAYMPAAIHYSHGILKRMAEDRRGGKIPGILPDSKSQVTLAYDENGIPSRAQSIVVSTQHEESLKMDDVEEIVQSIVKDVMPEGWIDRDTRFHINPAGPFITGGPDGDCGLTGRKIIVDTYGGSAPHGGGAFSGKDPSKVDRSAAYAARHLAKNIVAAGLAERCTIQLAYAIGESDLLSFYVDTHGTCQVDESRLTPTLREMVDLSPRGIRQRLGLSRPIYARTAAYGHFGRDPEADGGFSWERTDLASELKSAFA